MWVSGSLLWRVLRASKLVKKPSGHALHYGPSSKEHGNCFLIFLRAFGYALHCNDAAQRPHYRGFHPVCRDTPPSFSGMLDQHFRIICWKVVSKVRVVVFKLVSRLYSFCIIPLCQPLSKIFVHQKSLESAQKCDNKWWTKENAYKGTQDASPWSAALIEIALWSSAHSTHLPLTAPDTNNTKYQIEAKMVIKGFWHDLPP